MDIEPSFRQSDNWATTLSATRNSEYREWERPMKNPQRVRTRRQLLRVTAVGAASFPFLALAKRAESAERLPPEPRSDPVPAPRPTSGSCFLKGTKISTPSGDRPVQELR